MGCYANGIGYKCYLEEALDSLLEGQIIQSIQDLEHFSYERKEKESQG